MPLLRSYSEGTNGTKATLGRRESHTYMSFLGGYVDSMAPWYLAMVPRHVSMAPAHVIKPDHVAVGFKIFRPDEKSAVAACNLDGICDWCDRMLLGRMSKPTGRWVWVFPTTVAKLVYGGEQLHLLAALSNIESEVSGEPRGVGCGANSKPRRMACMENKRFGGGMHPEVRPWLCRSPMGTNLGVRRDSLNRSQTVPVVCGSGNRGPMCMCS